MVGQCHSLVFTSQFDVTELRVNKNRKEASCGSIKGSMYIALGGFCPDTENVGQTAAVKVPPALEFSVTSAL